MPPALVFFFNIPLAIWGLFWFHTNFRIICSSSVKNVDGIFFFKILFIYLAKRERAQAGGVREGEAGSLLSRELDMGLDPRTPRSGPEPKADT